jgi:ATP-binding cassette subfamily F protein uup
MEPLILEAEGVLEAIRAEMQSPEMVSDAPRLQVCYQNLQSAESRVQSLYARWAELEEKGDRRILR